MNHISALSHSIRIAAILVAAMLLTACANPGSGPDGGPYDETPPRIVSMSPAIGQRMAKDKKVTITFDELIKVENAQEKITISPPQIEIPDIKVQGRRITVELIDSLRENTTYTIDFSDAIVDANEGNRWATSPTSFQQAKASTQWRWPATCWPPKIWNR